MFYPSNQILEKVDTAYYQGILIGKIKDSDWPKTVEFQQLNLACAQKTDFLVNLLIMYLIHCQ